MMGCCPLRRFPQCTVFVARSQLLLANKFDRLCQAKEFECPNAPPVHVNLIPGKPVARCSRGRVKSKRDAEEYAPHQGRPTTKCQERNAAKNKWHEIQTIEPDMNGILHQVGCIAPHNVVIMLLGSTLEYPPHMR